MEEYQNANACHVQIIYNTLILGRYQFLFNNSAGLKGSCLV